MAIINADKLTENDYALWLYNVQGLGIRSIDKMMENGMSCRDIYEASSHEFKDILTPKQIKYLEYSRHSWNFEEEAEKLHGKGIDFIPRIDSRFPDRLRNIPDAPFALYVKGQLPDPEKPAVAIIGARLCSDYGRYMARLFGRGLSLAGVQVISGMARGVDGVSQKAALAAGGKSYGVVGCGVDVCYPEENQDIYDELGENGGIISEYAPGTMPKANFFPLRNRIISGLSDIVLVIEARQKSGTQITVDTALEQGREVLAVPGRVTDRLSDGCNLLISQGAGVALDVSDVLDKIYSAKARVDAVNNTPNPILAVNNIPETTCAKNSENNVLDDTETEEEMSSEDIPLDKKILSIIDVIPVSASVIIEELYKQGENISIPALIAVLMDMTANGEIVQEGAYYRKVIAV